MPETNESAKRASSVYALNGLVCAGLFVASFFMFAWFVERKDVGMLGMAMVCVISAVVFGYRARKQMLRSGE